MPSVDLSIIIVNWNSKDYLRKCLETVFAETISIKFEVVVIDGGSFDGCGEMIKGIYPQAHFIQCERNLGFAKANNEAIKASNGRNLLFLNPDTEIEGNALGTLLNQLEGLADAGIVGAKLLNSNRTVQTSCIRVFPSILNEVFDLAVLQKRFPNWRLWALTPLFDNPGAAVEVDGVSGACLMIKRSVFEAVGRFSTDYFMYSEDIDLCYKVRKAGYKTYYVPDALIVHHGGGSSSQSRVNTFSNVMMLESRWRFFRKTRPGWYGGLYRLAMFFASVTRISLLSLIWPARKVLGRVAPVEASLNKWTARLRWTLGFESWVQRY